MSQSTNEAPGPVDSTGPWYRHHHDPNQYITVVQAATEKKMSIIAVDPSLCYPVSHSGAYKIITQKLRFRSHHRSWAVFVSSNVRQVIPLSTNFP
jgi:hypothetical protein